MGVVLLGWAAGAWTRRSFAAVALSLLLLPALATVTTLDGTRVFAMVSFPALLVLLGWVVDRVEAGSREARFARRATIVALAASPLIPALITEPNGLAHFVFPWAL